MRSAAIYARVSSDQQKEENTIASQTAALIEFARAQDLSVPAEWIIEDEGFSGASLVRPGLERLRDLAAEGQIQAVLIYSPDRLSRKYAYQVLLMEEFARHGVETIFIKAPHSGTPEDQLMLQFQGMIAEYERAQILERSRRGKRHRAKAGEVSMLCGAPYGYRYIRKTSDVPARYEIETADAEVVRLIFEKYTVDGLSIGASVLASCGDFSRGPIPTLRDSDDNTSAGFTVCDGDYLWARWPRDAHRFSNEFASMVKTLPMEGPPHTSTRSRGSKAVRFCDGNLRSVHSVAS
jgi:DNA invertase Pin-like site-specific DNA recombinase